MMGIDGRNIECKQNICIMDNNIVNITNSKVGENIEFNQICNNCSDESPCSCIISSNEIDFKNSKIGKNVIPFSNSCNDKICMKTNSLGNQVPYSCDEMTKNIELQEMKDF